MKILFASSEAYPFSKTGGLGDVAGSLPKAMGKLGHEVFLITPMYLESRKTAKNLKRADIPFKVLIGDKEVPGKIWEGRISKNTKVLLVENSHYFDREGIYGNKSGNWPDNLERYTFFSKAVLEICKLMDLNPDIIHCHDWQTALIPTYMKTTHKEEKSLSHTVSVFTIHNLSYQGIFPHEQWGTLGLDHSLFTPNYLEFYGQVNLMKGGIIFSDSLNTVSVKYSQEIQKPEFGCQLEGLLKEYSYKLNGITNGVDYEEWDPSKDPFIVNNYSRRSMAGKAKCKEWLQKKFKLPKKGKTPLIAMVSRMVSQKGFDIIPDALMEFLKRDVQFIILGTGEESYIKRLMEVRNKFPQKMRLEIGYNNKLAHSMEAGADIWIMPSRFEPCGLNQLYSLKYGTIPVVTPVGGLDDTIKTYNHKNSTGNGFKMTDFSKESLVKAVYEALSTYSKKTVWKKLVSKAMGMDFSWEHSAKQYEKLFSIIAKKRPVTKDDAVIHIHPTKNLEA